MQAQKEAAEQVCCGAYVIGRFDLSIAFTGRFTVWEQDPVSPLHVKERLFAVCVCALYVYVSLFPICLLSLQKVDEVIASVKSSIEPHRVELEEKQTELVPLQKEVNAIQVHLLGGCRL